MWESKGPVRVRGNGGEGTSEGVGIRMELGVTFLHSQGHEKKPDVEADSC